MSTSPMASAHGERPGTGKMTTALLSPPTQGLTPSAVSEAARMNTGVDHHHDLAPAATGKVTTPRVDYSRIPPPISPRSNRASPSLPQQHERQHSTVESLTSYETVEHDPSRSVSRQRGKKSRHRSPGFSKGSTISRGKGTNTVDMHAEEDLQRVASHPPSSAMVSIAQTPRTESMLLAAAAGRQQAEHCEKASQTSGQEEWLEKAVSTTSTPRQMGADGGNSPRTEAMPDIVIEEENEDVQQPITPTRTPLQPALHGDEGDFEAAVEHNSAQSSETPSMTLRKVPAPPPIAVPQRRSTLSPGQSIASSVDIQSAYHAEEEFSGESVVGATAAALVVAQQQPAEVERPMPVKTATVASAMVGSEPRRETLSPSTGLADNVELVTTLHAEESYTSYVAGEPLSAMERSFSQVSIASSHGFVPAPPEIVNAAKSPAHSRAQTPVVDMDNLTTFQAEEGYTPYIPGEPLSAMERSVSLVSLASAHSAIPVQASAAVLAPAPEGMEYVTTFHAEEGYSPYVPGEPLAAMERSVSQVSLASSHSAAPGMMPHAVTEPLADEGDEDDDAIAMNDSVNSARRRATRSPARSSAQTPCVDTDYVTTYHAEEEYSPYVPGEPLAAMERSFSQTSLVSTGARDQDGGQGIAGAKGMENAALYHDPSPTKMEEDEQRQLSSASKTRELEDTESMSGSRVRAAAERYSALRGNGAKLHEVPSVYESLFADKFVRTGVDSYSFSALTDHRLRQGDDEYVAEMMTASATSQRSAGRTTLRLAVPKMGRGAGNSPGPAATAAPVPGSTAADGSAENVVAVMDSSLSMVSAIHTAAMRPRERKPIDRRAFYTSEPLNWDQIMADQKTDMESIGFHRK